MGFGPVSEPGLLPGFLVSEDSLAALAPRCRVFLRAGARAYVCIQTLWPGGAGPTGLNSEAEAWRLKELEGSCCADPLKDGLFPEEPEPDVELLGGGLPRCSEL